MRTVTWLRVPGSPTSFFFKLWRLFGTHEHWHLFQIVLSWFCNPQCSGHSLFFGDFFVFLFFAFYVEMSWNIHNFSRKRCTIIQQNSTISENAIAYKSVRWSLLIHFTSFNLSKLTVYRVYQAISELPKASVSKRGLVRSHWYKNDFESLANETHFHKKVLASFWKWEFLELWNGPLNDIYVCWPCLYPLTSSQGLSFFLGIQHIWHKEWGFEKTIIIKKFNFTGAADSCGT